MGSDEAKKLHAVLLPFPAQGHIIPMMQLAKLLHSKGFHITFVNTEFNHKRLLRSKGEEAIKGLPDFWFEAIPDGLPPSAKDATQEPALICDATRKNCLAPFLELLKRINSTLGVPPVTCIVSDGMMSFGIKAAEAIGVPEVQFWTASACGFMGYLQYPELAKRGIFPFRDESFMNDGTLDLTIDWVPGMSNMRLKDLPSFIRTTDPNDILFNFLGSEAQNCLKSSAILFNTFDEFEQEVLDAITAKFPHIYTTGPLSLLTRHLPETEINCFSLNLWKEDSNCIDWLNKRQPNSVVYVNYGSLTMMSENHLKEFAWGLADSKHPFLWIVRPDIVMAESTVLPEEFFIEIKDRGLLSPWCAQDKVLLHPSVAVFLTHCGWNSTMETVGAGKHVICWPFFAEQVTNCRYACTKWEIGMEVDHDVKRENIEALVREMMQGENGRKMRENVLEWKMKAEVATDVGGSSYENFERFIKEALLNKGCHRPQWNQITTGSN